MHSHLIPLLEKLAGHRVLCVGDVMLDRYVYGQVDRISPEAPIPVLRIQREAVTLGGSGNVVRNIVALGGQVDMIGLVGRDQPGYEVQEQIAALPEVTPYLLTDNGRPTTLKVRYIAGSQQLLRGDSEQSHPVPEALEQQILLRVRGALEGCSVVILSDYAKGVLTKNVVAECIKLANAKKCPVLIDPKGRDFERYHGAYMLTPNRRELSEATGIEIRSVEDAEKAARQLIAAHDLQGVLAKLGSDGVCVVMKDKPAAHFRVQARQVYDISGAGDTVVATMALALAGGAEPAEAAELANMSGSIVVGKIGTAVVTTDELRRELMRDQTRLSEEKIMSLPQALDKAERWRKKGLVVGFTNGVFDLLHPGHLSLIRQARGACDRLIVGINSDASTKRLKGEKRPLQGEEARALVLASLSDVDGVVVFDEDTPMEILIALRPDVLVKGADYRLEQVVGSDLVQGYGGKVILAELVEGQSTSSMIARAGK